MKLYRLGRSAYARKLDGMGARRYPGRWNSLGTPMIYCGDNRSLCAMEVLVHIDEPPDDLVMTKLFVPDDVPMRTPRQLPRGWKGPGYHVAVRAFGDAFINNCEHLLLRVPSAVVEKEVNYLLNPLHPDMERVKVLSVVPFRFDPRLFERR